MHHGITLDTFFLAKSRTVRKNAKGAIQDRENELAKNKNQGVFW